MKNVDISEILIKTEKRICSSKDIREITPENYLKTITTLINTRWIVRIKGFRGLYYVLDSEERQKSFYKLSNFEILINALNVLFKDEWYFGRITAVSLSGLINQPVSTYYIINKRFSKSIESKLLGNLVLIKISGNFGKGYGITANNYRGVTYFASTRQRNFTDYLYLYVHGHVQKEQLKEQLRLPYDDIEVMKNSKIMELIFKCYPSNSAIKMLSVFKEVVK